MSQNRPSLIKKFIGVASNTIVHKILVKTELEQDIRSHYEKEINRDIDVSLRYRSIINPTLTPPKETEEIKSKISLRVRAELQKRKDKGYNIDLSMIDKEINEFLHEYKLA